MTIGVHAVPAFKPEPTGVEHYAREVISRVVPLAKEQGASCILYTKSDSFEDPANLPIRQSADIRALRAPILWTQARLSWEMFRRPPDVLFVPGNALPRVLPKRTVLTVHGVEFLLSPQYFERRHRSYLTWLTRDGVRRADAVIVPSRATAEALMMHVGADERKLHVIPHGAPVSAGLPNAPHTISHIPFILYIGRLEIHKNVHGLVDAFSQYRAMNPDHETKLYLAGKPSFGYRTIRRAIERSPYRKDIRELGYINEQQKWELLRACTLFCLPSFSEGFGLPVLEAQAVGVPVMTSATTAMPEVAGRGAFFVDPFSSSSIIGGLTKVMRDEDLRTQLVATGRENLARFSWDKAAQQTLDVLVGNTV